MPRYAYQARDTNGALLRGTLEADTSQAAAAMIRKDGQFVVQLKEAAGRLAGAGDDSDAAPSRGGFSLGGKRIKRDEVIAFAHQLAIMVDTGVPLSEALECIRDQTTNDAFRTVIEGITGEVQAGRELSAALAEYPKLFPPVMTSLLRAAEASGTMGPMLERISGYLAKEAVTARKIKGALTYPAVMLTAVLGVTGFLLTWVLPQFAGIYAQKDQALPLPTQFLMAISGAIIHRWPTLLAVLIATIIAVIFVALKPSRASGRMDWLKINTPLIGPLFKKLYLTRATQTMGTMINAGVPILDMVRIVRDVTRNAAYDRLWDEADETLRRGSQLSDVLFKSSLIPRGVAQMIYSGERSGRLGQVMDKIAHFTEDEFDTQVKQTTQYFEPLLTAVMGIIIGFVAIALLLPIFKISAVVSG